MQSGLKGPEGGHHCDVLNLSSQMTDKSICKPEEPKQLDEFAHSYQNLKMFGSIIQNPQHRQ